MEMKQSISRKKAFTIVELIIVIAVIGVLAAILIPAFTNIIAKANSKSALSDARNTLTAFLAENLEYADGQIATSIVIFVQKAKMYYVYGYATNGPDMGKLMQSGGNPYNYEDLAELINTYNCEDYTIATEGTEEEQSAFAFYLYPHGNPSGQKSGGDMDMDGINNAFINLTNRVDGLPKTAQVFDGFLIGMIVDAGVHNPGGSGTNPSGDDNPSGPTIVPTEEPQPTDPPLSIEIAVEFYDTWNEELYETKIHTVSGTGNKTITKEDIASIVSNEFSVSTEQVTVDVQESGTNIRFDGTCDRMIEGSPFRVITNAIGLRKIDSQVDVNGASSMDAKYILNNNITSGMANWKPLGWVKTDTEGNPISTTSVQFSGIFDGGNYQISGLSMSWNAVSANNYVGLFARINSSGVIRNLRVLLTDTISGYAYVGVIAGRNAGTVSNVHVTNGVHGENIGIVQTTYTGSGGSAATGGIVAENPGGRIEKSSSCIYSINANGYCGGIAGTNTSGGVIDQCWSYSGINNTGAFASTAQRVGVIVGHNAVTSVSMSNCIAMPLYPICGNQYVGLFVGYVNNTTITNCYGVENGMITPSGDNPTNIGAAIGGEGTTPPTINSCYVISQSRTDNYFTVISENEFIAQSTTLGWDSDIWVIDGTSLPRLRYNPFQ